MPYSTVARQFFNIDRWIGATPHGNGHINDTYRIKFEKDGSVHSFLLQRLNDHIFHQPESVMDNIRKVSDFLAARDYPYQVAHLVTTLTGEHSHKDEIGRHWRIFPYISNSYTPEDTVSPEIAFEAAQAYGAFAFALRDFPAGELFETIPGFHDTDRRWKVFEDILHQDPAGRVKASAAEIAAIGEARPLFETISRMKKSGELPLRVTHNDTKAGNVLFDKKTHKALAVIDLDTVMPGTILSDFGDMVRTFAPDQAEDHPEDVRLRPEIVEALEAGFLSKTAGFLTETEKNHLMLGAAWMTGEQALRFLTDWLAGDVYYKIQHPEHNLVRARNQLALFRVILAKYS
jgi:Ser/Thr protein kinase RdoA (MazF antagonist)